MSDPRNSQPNDAAQESDEINRATSSKDKINSDTPYGKNEQPGPSSPGGTDAVAAQDRSVVGVKGEENKNERKSKRQTTGRAEELEKPTHGTDSNPPMTRGNADNANDEKDKNGNSHSSIDKTNGWVKVYDEYRTIDEDWVNQTDKYIDTLLVFAGLFSAVLTAFLVQVYTELQPDSVKHSAQVLLDLSNQLHALSLNQEAFPSNVSLTSVEQPESLVATTSLWFVSLILSLGAALFGILVKQWIREYMRWTTVFPLQHAIHVRYYRRRDLDNWHVDWIITIISECLEVGLVLFFAGLAVLLWRINAVTAHITTAFVALVLVAATITTALPAFALHCPYRTSFGLVLRKVIVLLRRIPPFIQITITSVKYAFSPVRDPWWIFIPEDFLYKWHDEWPEISDESRSTWPLLFTSWIKSDRMFNLPQDFRRSTIDRFTSLYWLTTHRTISEDVVTQCLSDLPGTPVALPKDEWEDGWKASSRKERQRQEFTVGCCALLSLMRSEKYWEERKEIDDLEKLLVATLPDRTQDINDASLPSAYKNIKVNFLSFAIRRANERSRNMLSTYFFSLTKDLLGSQQLLSQDTDIDLVKNLLRILLSLWLYSDYRNAQISGNVGSIDVNTDPAAQAFDCLRKVYVKLLAQSEQMTSQESQDRFASIIGLLGYDYGFPRYSFLEVFTATNPSDINPANLMKASRRYFERNREESSLDDAGPSDDKHRSKIQRPTQVFWEIAAPIFHYDVENHPNIPAEDCRAFLTAVETVLQVDIRTGSQYVYGRDRRFRYLPAYMLRHRSHLPDSFVSTLRMADEGKVIDIGGMLSQFDENNLPKDLHGIRDESAFWNAPELMQPEIDQAPEPGSAN